MILDVAVDARDAIDPTRIRAELGWQPSVTVAEGLRRTDPSAGIVLTG